MILFLYTTLSYVKKYQTSGISGIFDLTWMFLNNSHLKASQFDSMLLNSNVSTILSSYSNDEKLLMYNNEWETSDILKGAIIGPGISITGFNYQIDPSNGIFYQDFIQGQIQIITSYYNLMLYSPIQLITDTSKQNGTITSKELDFIYVKSDNIETNYETITLTLSHKMSLLSLTIYLANFTENLLSECSLYLSGIKHNGTYYDDGSAVINSDSVPIDNWEITNICSVNINSKSIECEINLFPQTLEKGIEFTLIRNEEQLNETLQIDTLESGYTYSCDLHFEPSTQTFTASVRDNEQYTQSVVITYSIAIEETYTLSNIIYSNTYLLSYFDSSYINTYTNYIFYQYTVIRYTTYYSFYSNFFYLVTVDFPLQNDNTKTIITIVVPCVIVVLVIITLVIIFVIRHQRNIKSYSDYSKTESFDKKDNVEVQHSYLSMNTVDIEDDPFANDFKETNNAF